jgi:hypothetical protein
MKNEINVILCDWMNVSAGLAKISALKIAADVMNFMISSSSFSKSRTPETICRTLRSKALENSQPIHIHRGVYQPFEEMQCGSSERPFVEWVK